MESFSSDAKMGSFNQSDVLSPRNSFKSSIDDKNVIWESKTLEIDDHDQATEQILVDNIKSAFKSSKRLERIPIDAESMDLLTIADDMKLSE